MALGCRIRRNFERPSKELVEAFRGIPVAKVDLDNPKDRLLLQLCFLLQEKDQTVT